jgi:anti-sigma28 factor (negative regulator of flagellin synthesis)
MSEGQENKQPRKRRLTEITLGWLAERLRRAERIKSAVQSGSYHVDTNKVASSIVNKEG